MWTSKAGDRSLAAQLTRKLRSVVIAIEFALMAVQPFFAHPGERWFVRDAPYPANNRRERRPAERGTLHTVLGARLKLEAFSTCSHSPSELQRAYPHHVMLGRPNGLDASERD